MGSRPKKFAFSQKKGGKNHTVTTADCRIQQTALLLVGAVPKQQFQWLGLEPIQEFHLTGSVSNIVI